MRLASRFNLNRSAFETRTLSPETFLKTVEAQLQKATDLQKLLQAAPVAPDVSSELKNARKHHALAASLLVQALTNTRTFLKGSNPEGAAQARLFLGEFFNELREASSPS